MGCAAEFRSLREAEREALRSKIHIATEGSVASPTGNLVGRVPIFRAMQPLYWKKQTDLAVFPSVTKKQTNLL